MGLDSPNAPWLRSDVSALTTVSFVQLFKRTYSVRCSFGARVTGDRGSQCMTNSDVLYIPEKKGHCYFWAYLLLYAPKREYLQLSNTVEHSCSSNGNFWRFIQQERVAWILDDIITVPSGEIDVRMSLSSVPKMLESFSFTRNMWGTHRELRSDASPIMGDFRVGATSLKTSRGSTKRSCSKAWILNCKSCASKFWMK